MVSISPHILDISSYLYTEMVIKSQFSLLFFFKSPLKEFFSTLLQLMNLSVEAGRDMI